jgi:hypothetical protein
MIKVYLTANVWYGSETSGRQGEKRKHGVTNEHLKRKEVKQKAIWSIHSECIKIPNYTQEKIKLTIIYSSKREGFDIDNKGYFWGKLFLDHIKRLGKIKEDTVKYVTSVSYKYKKGEEHLKFIIEKIC